MTLQAPPVVASLSALLAPHGATASLAGADAVYDAAFRQSGIIRVDVRRGMEGMLDVARMFVNGRRANGPRLTVVTMSGGAGVLIADVATEEGLELPEWSGQWRERMQAGNLRMAPAD
jgi:acyl-CoA synthetase (NDP forming)